MKNLFTMLLGVLCLATITTLSTGCNGRPLPMGPDMSYLTPTAIVPTPTPGGPTPTPGPTTKVRYLKIKGTSGIVSTIASVQVWVTRPSLPTEWLYNGSVTLDSTNGYQWSSPQSNPYSAGQASFYFSIPSAPSNQGLTDEGHVIVSSVDSIDYVGTPPANQPDGANLGW